MNRDWLRGKTVLITGAGGTLGKHLAYNLILQYNCLVWGIDLDKNKLSQFSEKISEYSNNFKYVCFDVSKEKQWDEFIAQKKPQVDVLINCIGSFTKLTVSEKLSYANLKKTTTLNYFATVISTQKCCQF